MTDELKAEREAFEKWVTEWILPSDLLARYIDGDYWCAEAQCRWEAWQARAKLDRSYGLSKETS